MTIATKYEDATIEISLEEYKELLEYKGRYLELKDYYVAEKYNIPSWTPGKITWTNVDTDTTTKTDYPYHYTCKHGTDYYDN